MQFNFIAKYYSFISRVAFGKSLETAKVSLFNEIPDNARVLLIGGGTGVSLSFLGKLKPHIKIDFVDVSDEMIKLAKIKPYTDRVNFFCTSIEDFVGDDYDVIITEFFLDLFKATEVQEYIKLVKQKLSDTGVWIDTDFRITKSFSNKILLKIMYLFFRLFSNVRVGRLIYTNNLIQSQGLLISKEHKFKLEFITSRLIVQ